jgi:hypothetical protein
MRQSPPRTVDLWKTVQADAKADREAHQALAKHLHEIFSEEAPQ